MIRTISRGCVAVLLICEFLLSGAGYCGHTHTHVHPGTGCDIGFMDTGDDCSYLPHSHDRAAGAGHKDGEEHQSHRCHCFCLGHVDAETMRPARPVFFTATILPFLPSPQYDFHFMKVIFHPPITA